MRWKNWLVPISGLLAALIFVLATALFIIGIPRRDVAGLARFLLLSSIPSLGFGYVVFHVMQRRLRSLGQLITLAYALGLAIVIINILITARLMFISDHDLTLLGLLLAFAAVLSLSFGLTLAANLTRSIRILARGAAELAEGNLTTRVPVVTSSELADLAKAFNQMATRLEEAFARQRQAEATRRDLVAAVSHDLRTPLASIRAMVEALADRLVSDPPTVERYLHALRGQIESLSALIDDLFELSQLERAHLALDLESGSLLDLISDTLESFRAEAERKGVNLIGQVEPIVDPVQMNPQKIQRVLNNLIRNAIRHTPAHGTVAITARPVPGGVHVDVADTGEGIAPEELPRVFDWFYRGEKSRSRAYGGAGLGLAIARSIVEAHGGRIWAQSTAGRGSTFSFILPQEGELQVKDSGAPRKHG
jgi:signal transduction histidine kinase